MTYRIRQIIPNRWQGDFYNFIDAPNVPVLYSIALLNVLPYIPVMVLTNSVRKTLHSIIKQCQVPVLLIIAICFFLADCSVVKLPYRVVVGTVMGSYYIVKGAYELTAGTTKLIYKIGEFTFKVKIYL